MRGPPSEIALRVILSLGVESSRAAQSAACRRLARRLLGGQWQIVAAEDGRPRAEGPNGEAGPDLSLAHSRQWSAAALALTGRVGIDVETPRPGRSAEAIAAAYLTAAERAVVAAEGEGALLAFWTVREAVAKAAGGGMGLALVLDHPGVVAARGGTAVVEAAGRSWAVAQRAVGPVQLALAWCGGGSGDAAAEEGVAAALDAAIASIHSAI